MKRKGKTVAGSIAAVAFAVSFMAPCFGFLTVKSAKTEQKAELRTGAKGVCAKTMVADYLEKSYQGSVEVNRRANLTKPGKGKTEGLPLADTHYVLGNGNKKCFAYVYETDGAVLLLVKAPSDYADKLKKEHKLVKPSAFPKSKDTWYSVPVDDSWTENQVCAMLDDLIKLNKEAEEKAD